MAHSDVINEIMHKSEYLNNYLSNAPYWLIESLCVVKKPKDKLIVEENAKADTIYILVDGTVRAVDYRIKVLHMIICGFTQSRYLVQWNYFLIYPNT